MPKAAYRHITPYCVFAYALADCRQRITKTIRAASVDAALDQAMTELNPLEWCVFDARPN